MRVLAGLKEGTRVLIDGSPYESGGLVGDGRVFRDPKTGDEILLSHGSQRSMALDYRLTLDDLPKNVTERIARARAASFNVFSFADRTIARRRLRYIEAIDRQAPRLRRREETVQKCIDDVFDELKKEAAGLSPAEGGQAAENVADASDNAAENETGTDVRSPAEFLRDRLMSKIDRDSGNGAEVPVEVKAPSPRRVKAWYRAYYAAGQDIRVLLDHHCLKGNRGDRYPEWVASAISDIIDTKIAIPTPVPYSKALNLACAEVRSRSAEGSPLPELAKQRGGEKLLGKNLIGKWVRKRDRYQMMHAQLGRDEAQREFSAVELGPQGEYPNHQWEVDHTPMDVFVIDEIAGKAYGRPWLTSIIDRYTRCIVGFSLSFAPPSWVSVMDALRVAVSRKDRLLAALNKGDQRYSIVNPWECHGIPVWLVTDHGREFKSRSLDETLAVLHTKPFHTKRRKPWLKGKIERWFGRLAEDLVHSIPGTTFSKFDKRKFYKSEDFAVLTLQQLNWVVTKWVVDVYHQQDHGKLRRSPALMWKNGICHHVPRTLSNSALQPLTGVVVNRCLRRGGVKYLGMRWDSKGFARLRARSPRDAEMPVRIDPRDLGKAYAWDDPNGKWIVGHLKEPAEAKQYSLDQWYFINTERKRNTSDGMERQAALDKAIADIHAFISDIQEGFGKSKAYKRYLEFTTQGRSAWDKVAPDRWDGEDDETPGHHTIDETPVRSPGPAETGPYTEPSPPLAPDDEDEDDEDDSDDDQPEQDAADEYDDDIDADDGDLFGAEFAAEIDEAKSKTAGSAGEQRRVETATRLKRKRAGKDAPKRARAMPKRSAPDMAAPEASPPPRPEPSPSPGPAASSDDEFKEDNFRGPYRVRARRTVDE